MTAEHSNLPAEENTAWAGSLAYRNPPGVRDAVWAAGSGDPRGPRDHDFEYVAPNERMVLRPEDERGWIFCRRCGETRALVPTGTHWSPRDVMAFE